MVKVIVVHKKKRFPVELRPEWTVADLKNVLYRLTELAPEDQKLLGIGHVQDSMLLKHLKLKEDQKVLLVGSARTGYEGDDTGDVETTASPTLNIKVAEGAFDMIGNLPEDLKHVIFSLLGHKLVGLCARVSREWYRATKNQFLWYTLFKRKWDLLYSTNEDWNEDWKIVYRRKWGLENNWKATRSARKRAQVGNVTCLTYDKSNSRLWRTTRAKDLVFTGGNSIVSVVDAQNLIVERALRGHAANVCSIKSSGSLIVSGDSQGNAILWDISLPCETLPWSLRSGELVAFWSLHSSPVMCVDITDDWFAAGASDGLVKVWDMNKSVLKYKFQNPEKIAFMRARPRQAAGAGGPAGPGGAAPGGAGGAGGAGGPGGPGALGALGGVAMGGVPPAQDDDQLPDVSFAITNIHATENGLFCSTNDGHVRYWDLRSGKNELTITTNNVEINRGAQPPQLGADVSHFQLVHDNLVFTSSVSSQTRTGIKIYDTRLFRNKPVHNFPSCTNVSTFHFDGSKLVAAHSQERRLGGGGGAGAGPAAGVRALYLNSDLTLDEESVVTNDSVSCLTFTPELLITGGATNSLSIYDYDLQLDRFSSSSSMSSSSSSANSLPGERGCPTS